MKSFVLAELKPDLDECMCKTAEIKAYLDDVGDDPEVALLDLIGGEHGDGLKTKEPHQLFRMACVWDNESTALEIGGLRPCCNNCNFYARRTGNTSHYMSSFGRYKAALAAEKAPKRRLLYEYYPQKAESVEEE